MVISLFEGGLQSYIKLVLFIIRFKYDLDYKHCEPVIIKVNLVGNSPQIYSIHGHTYKM